MEIPTLTPTEEQARQRTCLALDVNEIWEAYSLIGAVSDRIGIFKVNSLFEKAAMMGVNIIEEIRKRGGETFLDLKWHDTPQTVYNYAIAACVPGVRMFNIHAGEAGENMCKKAVEGTYKGAELAKIQRPKVIGVTLLTSLNDEDLEKEGIGAKYDYLVRRRTELSKQWGLDGVVCPANKAGALEKEFGGDGFMFVTPGIEWQGKKGEGQKQLYTPNMAVRDCKNSILVLGSAITKAEDKNATAYAIIQAMAKEL